MKETNISLSKAKLSLMLLGGLAFVAAGTWFMIEPEKIGVFRVLSPVIFVAGLMAVLFFGYCSVNILRKMFQKTFGLGVTADGIVDNSGAHAVGMIPWSDIKEIKHGQLFGQKFIAVQVKNPQDYIERRHSAFVCKARKKQFDLSSSSVFISANSLQIKHDELYALLQKKL